MTPIQLDRFAKVMVWALKRARLSAGPHGVYKPGDIVMLQYERAAGDLAERVYRELLQERLIVVPRPIMHFGMESALYETADDAQLGYIGSWDLDLNAKVNGSILLLAPESLDHLKDVDAKKMGIKGRAFKQIRDLRNARQNTGDYGWTLCELPTQALANQAQMSLEEYAHQVALACYLDDEDPVERWSQTAAQIDRVKAWLNAMPIDFVHLVSDDGETDLKVWLGPQRKWLGGTGQNIPSFEVFTSPAAGQVEGRYHASEASFREGNYVRNARLTFRNGEVVEATATEGEAYLREALAMDEGAKRLGEFSLTDRDFSQITKNMASTLYDENVGGANGNNHIAVGFGFDDAMAVDRATITPELAKELLINKSSLHWDLVTTSPRTVTAHLQDGSQVVIYRNGKFTLAP